MVPAVNFHGLRQNLYDLTRDELIAKVVSWDLSPVHGARLWSYLYYRCETDFGNMPELPAKVRCKLEEEFVVELPARGSELASTDGYTRKWVLGFRDGALIETVLMRFTGRQTACVSSQAGCAMGCVFCATGQAGFKRHLTTGEIVSQVVHVQRELAIAGERLRNVVLMGMGEPLHNYEAVMRAVDILRDSNGLALGAKKITVSTVGVVPGIIRMADECRPAHLAVSLHAATQEERERLVPTAKRWPLSELMDACSYYARKLDRRIFFEWALIEGENDGEAQAHAVGRLLSGLQAQVNLIPLNPTPEYAGRPGQLAAAKHFQTVLAGYGLPSTVRQRRGIDIAAGCGQLATRERT